MFLFLQSFRATLIPTIAVPVVLLGTFGVLAAAGFTINTLTMFAMVLAIGLLVDDAIVVVENVERVMSEEGLPPKEATRKSMDQITGALVGIAMVLAALAVLFVRLPGGFLPDEDQGNIFLQVQLPPGATMESTADVLRQLSTYLLEQEADAVESVVVVRGFNFSGRGQNAGLGFVKLKDWNVRKSPRLKAAAVARRAMGEIGRAHV